MKWYVHQDIIQALYLSMTRYVSYSLYVPRAVTMLQVTDKRAGGEKSLCVPTYPAGGTGGCRCRGNVYTRTVRAFGKPLLYPLCTGVEGAGG